MENKSYEARIITLGDSLVGKSCLIIRFIEDKYFTNYLSTIGFDLKYKLVSLKDGSKLRLTIHDTAGEERFRALSKNYIKKADGILVVYDITNRDSFINVESWIKCAKDELGMDIPIVLIGNKSDLDKNRMITYQEGQDLGNKYGIQFFETSCLNGNNVELCFNSISEKIVEYLNQKEMSAELSKKKILMAQKRKKGCCIIF